MSVIELLEKKDVGYFGEIEGTLNLLSEIFKFNSSQNVYPLFLFSHYQPNNPYIAHKWFYDLLTKHFSIFFFFVRKVTWWFTLPNSVITSMTSTATSLK